MQIQLYKVLLIIIKILPNLGYFEGPAYGEAKPPCLSYLLRHTVV